MVEQIVEGQETALSEVPHVNLNGQPAQRRLTAVAFRRRPGREESKSATSPRRPVKPHLGASRRLEEGVCQLISLRRRLLVAEEFSASHSQLRPVDRRRLPAVGTERRDALHRDDAIRGYRDPLTKRQGRGDAGQPRHHEIPCRAVIPPTALAARLSRGRRSASCSDRGPGSCRGSSPCTEPWACGSRSPPRTCA